MNKRNFQIYTISKNITSYKIRSKKIGFRWKRNWHISLSKSQRNYGILYRKINSSLGKNGIQITCAEETLSLKISTVSNKISYESVKEQIRIPGKKGDENNNRLISKF